LRFHAILVGGVSQRYHQADEERDREAKAAHERAHGVWSCHAGHPVGAHKTLAARKIALPAGDCRKGKMRNAQIEVVSYWPVEQLATAEASTWLDQTEGLDVNVILSCP
jgi:hypothetical protein